MTIVYNNHPVTKICIVILLITVQGPTWLCEISEDQRHMSKIFRQLTIHSWNPNECKFINYSVSRDWPV